MNLEQKAAIRLLAEFAQQYARGWGGNVPPETEEFLRSLMKAGKVAHDFANEAHDSFVEPIDDIPRD